MITILQVCNILWKIGRNNQKTAFYWLLTGKTIYTTIKVRMTNCSIYYREVWIITASIVRSPDGKTWKQSRHISRYRNPPKGDDDLELPRFLWFLQSRTVWRSCTMRKACEWRANPQRYCGIYSNNNNNWALLYTMQETRVEDGDRRDRWLQTMEEGAVQHVISSFELQPESQMMLR